MPFIAINEDKNGDVVFSREASDKDVATMFFQVMEKDPDFASLQQKISDGWKTAHLPFKERKKAKYYHPEYSDLYLLGFRKIGDHFVIDLTNDFVNSHIVISLLMFEDSRFVLNTNGSLIATVFDDLQHLRGFIQSFKPSTAESEWLLKNDDKMKGLENGVSLRYTEE